MLNKGEVRKHFVDIGIGTKMESTQFPSNQIEETGFELLLGFMRKLKTSNHLLDKPTQRRPQPRSDSEIPL